MNKVYATIGEDPQGIIIIRSKLENNTQKTKFVYSKHETVLECILISVSNLAILGSLCQRDTRR